MNEKRAKIIKTNVKSLCLDNWLEISDYLENEDSNDLFFVLNILKSGQKIYCQNHRQILQARIKMYSEACEYKKMYWIITNGGIEIGYSDFAYTTNTPFDRNLLNEEYTTYTDKIIESLEPGLMDTICCTIAQGLLP